MNLFQKFISKINSDFSQQENASKLLRIGEIDPICPHCHTSLPAMPKAKTKCKSCGNYMYVRTRPIDRYKTLIREDQIIDIEEQWAIASEDQEALKRVECYRREHSRLSEELGHSASDALVRFRVAQIYTHHHRLNRNFGLYRNELFAMAEYLKKDKQFEKAWEVISKVFYLDLNGPNNNKTFGDLRHDFEPKMGLVAPGVVRIMIDILEGLDQPVLRSKEAFLSACQEAQAHLHTPISPEAAWRKANAAIK